MSRLARVFLPLILFLPWDFVFGDVERASPRTVDAFRGDIVILRVSGSALSDGSWWIGPEKLGDGPTAEFNTSDWLAGEQKIEFHVPLGSSKWEFIEFTVDLQQSPPLYQPRRLETPLEPAMKRARIVMTPAFSIATRKGHVLVSRGKTQSTLPTPGMLPNDRSIYVPAGSYAVVRTPQDGEELLLGEGTQIAQRSGALVLERGDYLWRRESHKPGADEANSPSNYTEMVLLGYAASLTASNLGDVLVHVEKTGTESVADIAVLSGGAVFSCVGSGEIKLEAGQWLRVRLQDKKETCDVKGPSGLWQWPNLVPLLTVFEPWWDADVQVWPTERWRLEYEAITNQNGESCESLAVGEKYWGGVLDALVPCWKKVHANVSLLKLRGEARFHVGLTKSAQDDFSRALELSPKNPEIARLMGDLSFAMKNYESAMRWYLLAIDWGSADSAVLYRSAKDAAAHLKKIREAAQFSEFAYYREANDELAIKDLSESKTLLASRTYAIDADAKAAVVSHLLPVNPAVVNTIPGGATTERGIAVNGSLHWHKDLLREPVLGMTVHGEHDLNLPVNVKQSSAMSSSHEVGPEFSLKQGGKYWIKPSIGTRVSGMRHQTDDWKVAAGVQLDFPTSIRASMYSVRAFDPNPGFTNNIDLTLNRFAPDGSDHSHFDLGIDVLAGRDYFESGWNVAANLAQVDFRTGALDNFDHNRIQCRFGAYQRIERRWLVKEQVSVIERMFKTGGNDQDFNMQGSFGYFFAPLWQPYGFLSYGSRSGTIPEITYSHHSYGVGITAEL